MAENPEKNIPVFTVFKKGLIFKNIFLLDKTISPPSLISNPNLINSLENQNPRGVEDEEILLVGRHPDCNIVLEHPSISRFHLRIHLHPSLQKLFVIDLGSAHGTWISDQKIESHVPVELNEGDTLKLAASTRSYKLHWFPLSRAFDVENPPVPPNFVNLLPLEEEEDEEEEEEEETLKSEDLSFSFEKNPCPSAPPLPESMEVALFDDVEEQTHSSFSFSTTEENYDPNVVLGHAFTSEPVNFALSPLKSALSEILEQKLDKENQDNSPSNFAEFVPLVDVKQESQLRGLQKESGAPSLWSRRGKPASLIRVQTALSKVENMDSADRGELSPKVLFPCSDVEEIFTPGKENYTPTSEFGSKSGKKGSIRKLGSLIRIQTASSKVENMDSADQGELSPKVLFPCSDVGEVFTPGKENYTPTSELGSKSGKKGSIRKLDSLIRIQTASSKVENMDTADQGELSPKVLFPCSDVGEVFTPGKENYTPTSELGSKSGKKGSIRKLDSLIRIQSASSKVENMDTADQGELSPKVLFPCSDVEEVFTPGKENYTPTSELGPKSGKKGSRRKLEHQRSCGSTLSQREPRSGSRLRQESDMITNSRRAGREPFQTLIVNSFSHGKPNVSVHSTKTTSIDTITCDQKIEAKAPLSYKQTSGEATRRWYMVADTNSLLNKDSRRSLQLLYGLKGTQLIIPRTVMRELDSLKRQGSLFGSVSEASFALQWIETCLVETKNWIHVQDSTEEDIAPTPPASPQWSSQLSHGISKVFGKQVPSFSWSSLLPEIVTPTAHDCMLDSALFFKNEKKDGQLVLLSNDVSLKIKAMAEGVLCESAEEFRISLVDPYSERFLWAGSTPRGPTWSCLDEAGPREKLGYVPVKNGACKEANSAKKGLKLILRHNYSHYGQHLASVR